MPSYRFYKLTSGKRVAAPGEDHDFESDLPAFAYARRLANGSQSVCGRERRLSRMWNRRIPILVANSLPPAALRSCLCL
jgi:hypothetical protein